MSGIIRKSLLIKYQLSDRNCVAKNFTVLKYSYSPYSAEFQLQIPDFNEEKKCRLLIFNGKQSNLLDIDCSPHSGDVYTFKIDFPVSEGISIAIFDKTSDIPIFYGSNLKNNTLQEMTRLYEEYYKKHDKQNDKTETGVFSTEKNDELHEKSDEKSTDDLINDAIFIAQPKSENVCAYDDEAVATENYYEEENKTLIEEVNYDNLSDSTVNIGARDEDFRKQTESNRNVKQNDEIIGTCPFVKKQPRFYEEKSDEIERLFSKYPPIGSLSQYIPESKWVKIEYKKDGYYIIGVIKKDGVPQYIVYGVPGNREIRPRGFERYSVFLPESLFTSGGRGFWCTFQDAESGKIQNPETT